MLKSTFKSSSLTEDVADNNSGICLGINQETLRRCDLLSSLIHVMDKYDEENWTVDWPKRHDIVSKLGTTSSVERQYWPRAWSNSYLIIARCIIHQPP